MNMSNIHRETAQILKNAARHMLVASLGDKPENTEPALRLAAKAIKDALARIPANLR
jgi:hypothetical protein